MFNCSGASKAVRASDDDGTAHKASFKSDIDEAINSAIIKSATEYAIIAFDHELRIIRWNDGACNILGWTEEEMIGQPADRVFTPEDRLAGIPEQEARAAQAEGRASDDRWHLKKDGSRFWASGLMMPLYSSSGAGQIGFLKVVRDRTKLREFMDRERTLKHELAHRMKNTLTLVQALANRSFRQSDKDAKEAFQGRLQALALAQNIFFDDSHALEPSLHNLIASALSHHSIDHRRITIGGDNPKFTPSEGLALSLALHELITNAIKYGSLCCETGSVLVTCSRDARGLDLQWIESGGPPVVAPTKFGFGSRLIERNLAAAFNGHVDAVFAKEGIRIRLFAPMRGKV
jgi:PAS domain S-box-containing protein